jgi:Putative prokaryotic signal transducing protein
LECSDCHVPLKSGRPPDPPPPDPPPHRPATAPHDLELVPVLECENSVKLALAEGLLEDAGIPYLLNGRVWGVGSKFRPPKPYLLMEPFTIQVPNDRADEARALLAHLSES